VGFLIEALGDAMGYGGSREVAEKQRVGDGTMERDRREKCHLFYSFQGNCVALYVVF
jgi:hypothetical protein